MHDRLEFVTDQRKFVVSVKFGNDRTTVYNCNHMHSGHFNWDSIRPFVLVGAA